MARSLAELALAEAQTPERLDAGLRRLLASRLAATAPGRQQGSLRLDSYRVLDQHEGRSAIPFAWSPRTSRRLIGLAAARRVAEGRSASPLSAVRSEIEAAVERTTQGLSRPGTLAAWLAEAPLGVLAAVTAEAVGYASDLTTLLDLELLAGRAEVGLADRVWAVPGAPWVSLRSRRDVEISLDAAMRTRALVALRPGRPDDRAVDDLSVVALADALSRPDAPLPSRVLGVWPSTGRVLSLEVDAQVMRRAARLVDAAVDALGRRASVALAA
jgi:hypothetical protein